MELFIRTKPYTGGLKAAIFDWAGTMVDHGCVGPVASFLDVFRKNGVELTLAEAREPMGLDKKDHIRALIRMDRVAREWEKVHGRRPDETDVDAMYPATEALMVQSMVNHSEPIPGAVEALEELRSMGLKIGSCTGYTRPMVDVLAPAAAAKGIKPDAVICSSDVGKGRPYPFMAWLNAIRLEVYPVEACVKVGDTVADIQEGLNAGMWTIALTRTGNDVGLTLAEAEKAEPSELAEKVAMVTERFRNAGAHYVAEGIWEVPGICREINRRLSKREQPL